MRRNITFLSLGLLLAACHLATALQAEPIRHPLRAIDGQPGSWALSRDGGTLAELTADGAGPEVRLSVWRRGQWTERATVRATLPEKGEVGVRSLVLGDDGQDLYLLCRAGKDSPVWLLHSPVREPGFRVQSHGSMPASLSLVAGQGTWLLAHDAERNATGETVFLFDLAKKTSHHVALSEMPDLGNLSAGFSPSGDRLALLFEGWGRSHGYVVELSGGGPGKSVELDLQGLGFQASAPPPRFTAPDRFGFFVANTLLSYDGSGRLISATRWKPTFGEAVEGKLSGDGRRAVVRVDPPFGRDYLTLLDTGTPLRGVAEYECGSLGNAALPSEGPTSLVVADLGASGDAIVAWPAEATAASPVSSSVRSLAISVLAGLAFFLIAVTGWAYLTFSTRSGMPKAASDTCASCGFALTTRGRESAACTVCGSAWLSSGLWRERRDVVTRLWGWVAVATLALFLVAGYLLFVDVPASSGWPRDLFWQLVAASIVALGLVLIVGLAVVFRRATPSPASLDTRKAWAIDSRARIAALVAGEDQELVVPALRRIHGESHGAWVDAVLALEGKPGAREIAIARVADEIPDRDLLLRLLQVSSDEDRAAAILKKLGLPAAELKDLAAGENEVVALAAAKRLIDPAAMESLAESAASGKVRSLAKRSMEASRKEAERREAEARRQAESARVGTTPGVVFFSLDGTLPDETVASMQISMFAMTSGNAHLMMDAVPKMIGSLPAVPESDDEVAAAYRRLAERLHWKPIDPTVQVIFKAGVPVFAIAFPQPENFG